MFILSFIIGLLVVALVWEELRYRKLADKYIELLISKFFLLEKIKKSEPVKKKKVVKKKK